MSGSDTWGARIMAILPWLILVAACAGAWATWQHMRPRVRPDLPPPLQRFSVALDELGWRHESALVRASSPVAGMVYNAMYTEPGSDRVVYLQWFNRPDAARAQAERLLRLPEEQATRVSGVFVLRLPRWVPDDGLTRRVQARFDSFAQEAGQPDPAPGR